MEASDAVTAPMTTAVIGAGPAGLLFAIVGRLLHARAGTAEDAWRLRLFDKRTTYARTHRLRIDPLAYRAIAEDVEDARFEALLTFLERERFQPEVNLLEERLSGLASELGVSREQRAIGDGPGAMGLDVLRAELLERGDLHPRGRFTIVGADSVHSTVREWARGEHRPVRHVHQQVARLRVIGPALPERLAPLAHIRLSKVLGSLLDYRRNANGFAEVDLFLTERDHGYVRGLGASPKAPVRVRATQLSRLRAPLFRRIVEHLERGFGGGPCEVQLYSGFELEHMVMPRLVFSRPEVSATVFLVGDAGISLPFFRGMACLAACAHRLAHVHADLAAFDARSPAVRADAATVLDRSFRAPDRPTRFGAWLLPGEIVDVRSTVHRGRPSFAVLHRFAGRWGAHVLEPRGDDGWTAHHHLAPVSQARATESFLAWAEPALRYEREADEVKRRELAIVGARARLIALAREISRVSALLPFPIQSWLLSAPTREEAVRSTRTSLGLNAVLAAVAAALALGGPALAWRGVPHAAWLAALALPVQALGGVAYHALPSGSVRAIWRAQTVVLFGAGVPLALVTAERASSAVALFAAVAWLVLAAMFVVGLYAYERLVGRWLTRAGLAEAEAELPP